MTLPSGLEQDLRQQIVRVAQHGFAEEDKIRNAVKAVPELVRSLGLQTFVDMLVRDDKPRLLLRFAHTDVPSLRHLGTDVVLKVYGDKPRGEGPLLREWATRGVPVPVLEAGETEHCSWLLMEHLAFAPMELPGEDWFEYTDTLAVLGGVMHLPAPQLYPVLRHLDAVMLPRWDFSRSALLETGWAVPVSWRTAAETRYWSAEPAPLHGDLAPSNIAARSDGSPILFDASALLGPQAFDAARWSARLAIHSASPFAAFSRWLTLEPCDDPGVYELLAAECVLEAGSLEIMRSRSRTALGTRGADNGPRNVDHAIEELLRVARNILD